MACAKAQGWGQWPATNVKNVRVPGVGEMSQKVAGEDAGGQQGPREQEAFGFLCAVGESWEHSDQRVGGHCLFPCFKGGFGDSGRGQLGVTRVGEEH